MQWSLKNMFVLTLICAGLICLYSDEIRQWETVYNGIKSGITFTLSTPWPKFNEDCSFLEFWYTIGVGIKFVFWFIKYGLVPMILFFAIGGICMNSCECLKR